MEKMDFGDEPTVNKCLAGYGGLQGEHDGKRHCFVQQKKLPCRYVQNGLVDVPDKNPLSLPFTYCACSYGKNAILFVDDANLHNMIGRILIPEGYTIITLPNSDIVLATIDEFARKRRARGDVIKAVFTGEDVGVMKGTQLLERIAAEYPDMIRVIHTDYPNLTVSSVERGIAHLGIAKPYTVEQLKDVAGQAMRLYDERMNGRQK